MPSRIVTEGPNGQTISITEVPECPRCGGKMKLISGPYGDFWGCLNYPHCKGKRPIDGTPEVEEETEDERIIRELWGSAGSSLT